VVFLDKNNRILVHHGINRIRHEQCSPGILALLHSSRRKTAEVNSSDLGYIVAPRLNAAGRLEDMSLGVACLLSEDKNDAEKFALELEQLNAQRREIESEMTYQAEKILPQLSLENPTIGLCVYHQDFHQGVIGILAGRLKDRYHRPVIVFSKVNETELKGSARSIQGCHLRDILALIDTKKPGLINKFGGHAMAAGLSIDENNFSLFSDIFIKTLNENIQPEILHNILLTDGELFQHELTIDSAVLLQNQLIWGQGFPEPLFQGNFIILDQKLINQKHLKLKLKSGERSQPIDAIFFNYPEHISVQHPKKLVNFVYRLSINEYLGLKSLQLIIEYVEG
jgi:single-stranded-DNA-specific exonuclease